MSWIYGQQWGMLGLEHERIECENKRKHKKPTKDGGGSNQKKKYCKLIDCRLID